MSNGDAEFMNQELRQAREERTSEIRTEDVKKVLDFPVSCETDSFDNETYVTTAGDAPLVTGEMDRRHPGWSSKVSTARLIGGYAVVIVNITASGSVREGIGYAKFSGGSGFVAAENMAFAEAAAKFAAALGSDQIKDGDEGHPVNSVATCLSDLVTYSQIRSIRRLAKAGGVDVDNESERRFGCLPGELSRVGAELLLSELNASFEGSEAGFLMAG